MNVLIVEDNADDRRLLRYTLEHYGCSVIEAHDGEEGLRQLTCHCPDIIVSDALMPRMDGFQFLRVLMANPEYASIPFLFYSAVYTSEAEEQLALSLGAAAFVVKPAMPEVLWQKITAIVASRESRSSTVSPAMNEKEEYFLREYSRVVATKLEEKVRELEEALAQRQQAENALREQEHELATVFENAPFMMLLLDGERRVRRMNGIACAFSGAPATGLIGKRNGEVLRCLHALDTDEGCGFTPYCRSCVIRRSILDTYESGRSHHQVEVHLPITVDGEEHEVVLLLSTTKVIAAHKAMVLLSLQDISDYKKLETQLYHAQKMESIGTLAGGIAHDFNNILTVIVGYADIALMNDALPPPLRQSLEQMLGAARRGASLARDLLLFSRKQSSDKKHVDLNDIVRSVEKFLLRVIGEDIVSTIRLADEAMPVFADAHQLEQVLMNFATNARDAMPHGGTLSIVTERIELDDAFIAVNGYGNRNGHVLLTVADTGTGMSEETCGHIFDPFFTTKEIGKGTGLGLSIVYGIVKHHDGHIMVSSEPDHGTVFKVYLPLSSAAPLSIPAAALPGRSNRGTETILLAEDDDIVRKMTILLLEGFGYHVIEAIDGDDAVQKFLSHRERISLLLFDIIMPNKSGIVAFEEIRKTAPDIEAIFTSGYAVEAVHQQAFNDDHVSYIEKPCSTSTLLTAVRSALDRGKS